MAQLFAEVELINGEDRVLSRQKIIPEENVKRINILALVNDKAKFMLAINENIQEHLKAPVKRMARGELANGEIISCPLVDNVYVHFKDRQALCEAIVLPGNSVPILGDTILILLDVLVDPQKQELIVNTRKPRLRIGNIAIKHLSAPG